MRVLIVHNRYRSTQPSGETTVVDDEAALLSDRGVDVHRLELESDQIAEWSIGKKALLPLRVIWSYEGYRLTRRAIGLASPDVVHFHNTFPLFSPSALWAAHRSPARVVMTLHNFRPLCPAGTFFRDGRVCEDCLGRFPWPSLRHECYRDSRVATIPLALTSGLHGALDTWVRCVDTFVAPTDFARRKYVEAGWPREKFVVKYNTAPDHSVARAGTRRGFVSVSRLAREKGIDTLLEAWGQAFPGGEEHLTVIGSGPEQPGLRRRADSLNGVTFAGQLSGADVRKAMASARALVVPSRSYEVFPRVVLEAYSLGLPVIASEIGGLAEVVQHGATGVLAASGSSQAFARALAMFADSDGLSERLGAGARRAYDERYSPSRTTERLLSIYGLGTALAEAAAS